MEDTQKHNTVNGWMYMILGLILITIISVFYFFFYQKSYDMTVETACDPSFENCFYRDCESEECPPSGLSYYSQYTIRAADFSACDGENCTTVCKSPDSPCQEILCDSSVDTCSDLPQ